VEGIQREGLVEVISYEGENEIQVVYQERCCKVMVFMALGKRGSSSTVMGLACPDRFKMFSIDDILRLVLSVRL
jgi:hypothetical protein